MNITVLITHLGFKALNVAFLLVLGKLKCPEYRTFVPTTWAWDSGYGALDEVGIVHFFQ